MLRHDGVVCWECIYITYVYIYIYIYKEFNYAGHAASIHVQSLRMCVIPTYIIAQVRDWGIIVVSETTFNQSIPKHLIKNHNADHYE